MHRNANDESMIPVRHLNNHKIPNKTQHTISIVLYSVMFRLEGVIIRLY